MPRNRERSSFMIEARSAVAVAFLGFLLVFPRLCTGAGERFDFVATSGTLGFGQPHRVELRTEAGKPLLVRATGNDPYFHSPRVSLRATRQGVLVVKAAFEGPVRSLALFFATDTSPNFGEDKMLPVRVRADGKEHEVRLLVGLHPLWQGTITRYRFDLEPNEAVGAVMRLASVAYVYPTDPVLNKFTSSASVLGNGTTATLTVELENATPDAMTDLEVRFQPSTDTLTISPAQRTNLRLAFDGRTSLTAVVRAERDGVAVLDAILLRGGVELDRRNLAICVGGDIAASELATIGTSRVGPGGRPWAGVMNAQALAIRVDAQSGLAEWWARDSGGFSRVARIFPLVSLLHGERERHLEIVRWRSWTNDSLSRLSALLVGDLGPKGQELAEIKMNVLGQEEEPFGILVQVTLEAKRPVYLRAFVTPKILAGDGTFGDRRDEGLLPGVEYLEQGERSSSRLDYHADEYLRTVPHPKKITVPLMALTCGNHLIMLNWDSPRPNGDGLLAPAAGFASPNFVEGQKNHLMTLFWPSVPDLVRENSWEAEKPTLLNPGQRLDFQYRLYATTRPGIHVTEAIPTSFGRMGKEWQPPLPKPPRDVDAERALCRIAYTDVVWRENERGWNHALPASATQWAPQPYTFNLQFLESERAEMTSGPERTRISQTIEQAAARRWKMNGERPTADDYYFVGETLLGCIEAKQAQARYMIKQQRDDGSWGFDPRDPQRSELGAQGQAELGIVADHAIPILQYALMTGDREAEAAGLRALEQMKRYVIPRAAQVWEIPLHTPDIMGSARGATAYRLGYLLTGKGEYLERADYWLATGLPFVYSWGHPNWPYWRYATIPVFGATHYRAPNWEGLPVQWCGLVYAEEMLRCAPLLHSSYRSNRSYTSHDERVAVGILHSGMWQQPAEGEYRGLLPDSYPFASKTGNGPFINPETILRPLWLTRGFDFRVNSVVLPRGADRALRLSALVRITTATMATDRSLAATFSAVRGLPFGVSICGLASAPLEVSWQGKPVARRDSLNRNESCWNSLSDRSWLLINLIGSGKEDELVVR